MNYEKDIIIDETALDIEWLNQAKLAMKYIRHYAQCRRILTQTEEKIKILRAELIREANENPIKCCKKEKPNAADIEAYYRNDNRHKAAKEEWIEAQYELDMAEGAKSEVCFTRKISLENMVKLYNAGYFAGPEMPRDLPFELKQKEAQEASNVSVARKLQRNRS